MALEEKIDLLTKELVALRKTIEANNAAKAAPAAESDAAPAKKAPAKKAAAKPTHTVEEVGGILRDCAKHSDELKQKVKEYIGQTGSKDLADLLTKPEMLDEAFDWATGALAEANEDGGDEDDI